MYPNDPNMTPVAPRKRHPVRKIFGILGTLALALILVIIIDGALSHTPSGGSAGTAASPAQSTAAPATQSAVPAVATPTPTVNPATKVTFIVTGTGEPSITYGTDSDNRDGGGTLGELGDGNAVPWTRSLPFDGTAMFYDITAQLEGTGDITCKIVVTGPGDQPLTVATGHASGGENICDAQAAPSDSTGTSWQSEG